MLAETKSVDRLEILQGGIVQIRHRTVITDTETGQVRASHFERSVLRPGDSLSGLDPQSAQIVTAAWTPVPEPVADQQSE